MRETTIRRLLVIVLCASGVVALWIVADRSLSTPDAVTPVQPAAGSPSGIRPAPSVLPTAASQPPVPAATATTTPGSAGHRTDQGEGRAPVGRHHPAGGQVPGADARPAAVRGLRVIQADHDSITIRWSPVTRAAGTDRATGRADPVAYYHATLNGIPVGDTAGLQLTIDWFNDDMTSHFIRVNAIAPDGTRGLSGNALVVDRPAAPSPNPPASPSPGPAQPSKTQPGNPSPGNPSPSNPSPSNPSPSPAPTTPPTSPSSGPTTPSPSQSPTQTPTPTPTPPGTVPPTGTPTQTDPPITPATGDPESTPAVSPSAPTAPTAPAPSAPPASDPHQ